MIRKFNFDYDKENDSLFLFDPKSKTKASIEMDDIVIDFNNKKEVSGIELLHATAFFKGLDIEGKKISKQMLKEITQCKIEIIPKNNFIMIRFMLQFKSRKQLTTPVYVPSVQEPSPALTA